MSLQLSQDVDKGYIQQCLMMCSFVKKGATWSKDTLFPVIDLYLKIKKTNKLIVDFSETMQR